MRFTKTLLTAVLLGVSIFSFQSTAWADTFEQQFAQGSEAFNKGDYQTAFKLFQSLAEQGHSRAQYLVGSMYDEGKGIKKDDFEAVKWLQKAAQGLNPKAQYDLAIMFKEGRGVKQDNFEAVKWFQKAAEYGMPDALLGLGIMYEEGKGVRQDRVKAKELFGKACDNRLQEGCEYYSKLNSEGL